MGDGMVIRRSTLAERCEGGSLRLDDTVDTWGMGRCCLHCGLPVTVSIFHSTPSVGRGCASPPAKSCVNCGRTYPADSDERCSCGFFASDRVASPE